MKHFLSAFLGVLAAAALLGLAAVLALAVALYEPEPDIETGSVLVVKLEGALSEQGTDDIVGTLTGTAGATASLADILDAIHLAKDDSRIKGIYLQAGAFVSDSNASAAEIVRALEDFRRAGKFVVAYADSYTQTTYYICSVADRVCLNPQGIVDWRGFAAQPMLLKHMLAKVGIRVQLAKAGRYKSMPETYTADSTSADNRRQIQEYVSTLWRHTAASVLQHRQRQGMAQATAAAATDSLLTFADPRQYVALGFVDTLMYADAVRPYLNSRLGLEADDDTPQVSVADMLATAADGDDDPQIAVYTLAGDVVDFATGTDSEIAADRVVPDLRDLADDDEVRAVVLRINSGGGSAYASEQIWHAVSQLRQRKPVVVSMGGMAASGAYYIATAADRIVAQPTTLTGSIGVFGMFPDASELLTDKLGIRFTTPIKSAPHSDFGTVARPFNAAEQRALDAHIARCYALFLRRVADGRHITTQQAHAVAQGRVWTGEAAQRVHLVDQLGGTEQAIAAAAALAHIDKPNVCRYPEPPSFLDQILGLAQPDSYIDQHMKELVAPFAFLKTLTRQNCVQARLPFVLRIE